MKNRTIALSVILAFLHASLSAFVPRHAAFPADTPPPTQMVHEECPPPSNIKVELLQGGKAIISWDLVPGVPKYKVVLEDENLNILLDSLVNSSSVLVANLIPGEKYKVSICYGCPETGRPVCNFKTFRYIIIEDQVVMFDGNSPCSCKTTAETEGLCNSSASPYYSLVTSRVYNIQLSDNSSLAFLCKNTVNPVGNCRMDLVSTGLETHGDYGAQLPYYQVGNSKIFFHGSTFCIQGESTTNVTYCEINVKDRTDEAAETTGIFPNPFSDLIIVNDSETGMAGQQRCLQLFDASGRMVLEKESDQPGVLSLQTQQVPPGLYWLCMRREGHSPKTERLLKLK